VNALKRFWSVGARDADARLAAALAPQPFEPADRYLRRSAIVTALDRATVALERWWLESMTGQSSMAFADTLRQAPQRRRGIAIVLLVAVVVHVTLTMIQGPRPGWFWLIVPALTALSGLLLIAGTRSPSHS
jgi:hypothetical protein